MFHENLKHLREAAGLTQVALADQIDVPLRTLHNWEQGRREPDLNTLVELARILSVTTDALLIGEDEADGYHTTTGESTMKTVWRLMTHHEDPDAALLWAETESRLAVGWGKIGDIAANGYATREAIFRAIRQQYQDINNANRGSVSLLAFHKEMNAHDFVILNTRAGRRLVMEVVGEYAYQNAPHPQLGDYQHQRSAKIVQINPNELWQRAGGKAAGQNIRWPLIRCQKKIDKATETELRGA